MQHGAVTPQTQQCSTALLVPVAQCCCRFLSLALSVCVCVCVQVLPEHSPGPVQQESCRQKLWSVWKGCIPRCATTAAAAAVRGTHVWRSRLKSRQHSMCIRPSVAKLRRRKSYPEMHPVGTCSSPHDRAAGCSRLDRMHPHSHLRLCVPPPPVSHLLLLLSPACSTHTQPRCFLQVSSLHFKTCWPGWCLPPGSWSGLVSA